MPKTNVCLQIKRFPRPPQCTVVVVLDMSKAFDTVNIHKLIHKLTLTNNPNIIIIKFIATYIKGQQACTQYNRTLSKLKQINTGVQQGGVLSPTLFNIYTSDIPLPPKDIQITTYADVITITASHTKYQKKMFANQKNDAPSPNCECGTSEKTADHVLTACLYIGHHMEHKVCRFWMTKLDAGLITPLLASIQAVQQSGVVKE